MKFLVLGSTGMAGHTIMLYLKERGHQVDGFARGGQSQFVNIIGDIKDEVFLNSLFLDNDYVSVINCIGVLNEFADNNKSMAVYLNSYLPHMLTEITKNMNTQVIHISTDCVFSGKRGNYIETDFKDGETFYDRTKAVGELYDGKNITLRNSIVGPDMKRKGIGLLNWFMQQDKPIYGYAEAKWTGITTLELAKIVERLAMGEYTGLYNMVNNKSISKLELLNLFNNYFRNNVVSILPTNSLIIDKSLVRTRFDFEYIIPNYETMIQELAEWLNGHKHLYPHYNL